MKPNRFSWLPVALVALMHSVPAVHAQDEQASRMQAALASSERSEEARSRDAGRKPIAVVQFLGIETGDTVVDVIAAAGWYTEVLSAAVGPGGKVYAQNPPFFTDREGFVDAETALHQRLGNAAAVHGDLPGAIAGQADAAISALNFHDIYQRGGAEGAVAWARGVYDSLKPGGVFGVIDHVGADGQDNAALHRVPAAAARQVLTDAGFVVEAESDLLHNPEDDHTLGIREEGLRWNTDRFLIRARKPQ